MTCKVLLTRLGIAKIAGQYWIQYVESILRSDIIFLKDDVGYALFSLYASNMVCSNQNLLSCTHGLVPSGLEANEANTITVYVQLRKKICEPYLRYHNINCKRRYSKYMYTYLHLF